jgi:eukaryotic-like serine/threonine-protein kinase
MALTSGSKLGPYEIQSPLGAGGMGEVYRAHDSRLDRDVAIKVLSTNIASNPDLRQRFEREARAIAALNHPHICTLHDVGHEDGIDFLVMEYLDGETLANRLQRGALPLNLGLQYAMQIADALDRAHREGIVHRDLKPGNIMLVKNGAKLLDFGLAKTTRTANAGMDRAMLPTAITVEGTILGTLQYMAPEQLEGHEADARTDIFAFGALLYEMLTGQKAFDAKTQASLISSIMSSQPASVSTIQPVVPAGLDRLVERCLVKDREQRWQSLRDVKIQLAWAAEQGPPSAPLTAQKRLHGRIGWAIVGLAIVALLVTVTVLVTRRLPTEPLEPSQFVLLPPEQTHFASDPNSQSISPDGRYIAFVAQGGDGRSLLWIRPIDSLAARPLAGTDEATSPFWSPDNRAVGFFAQSKLKRIDAAGGPVQTLADAPVPLGGTWSRDDVIVFGAGLGSPLLRIHAGGGAPSPASDVNITGAERAHALPHFLPDGRHFLFAALHSPNEGSVYVGSIDSADAKPLSLSIRTNSAIAYSLPGYLLFVRDSVLMAQPFNVSQLSITGDAVAIAEAATKSSAMGFTASERGTLIYRSSNGDRTQLIWVDRMGKQTEVAAPPGLYGDVSLSPDDKRLAFDREGPTSHDVWLMELQRGITSRLTFQPPNNNVPLWSPDGRTIAFASSRDGGLDIYQRPSNGSGKDEPLLKLNAPPIMFPSDWSSDGRFLAYYRTDSKTGLDIWVLPLDDDRKPFPLFHAQFNESQAQFSPDGRWVAYVSDEAGTPQIYVQSFPMLTGKWQISTGGGTQPRWRRDGKELFYLALDRKLTAVTIRPGTTFEAERPHSLFQTALTLSAFRQEYSVSADGQRFLLNAPLETTESPMTVVLNWPALLLKK